VCVNPQSGQAWELRHLKPIKGGVDGLSPLCDGCRHRFKKYRQLITKSGMSETQAEEECRHALSHGTCKHRSSGFFQSVSSIRAIPSVSAAIAGTPEVATSASCLEATGPEAMQ